MFDLPGFIWLKVKVNHNIEKIEPVDGVVVLEGSLGVPDHPLQRVLSQMNFRRVVNLSPGDGYLVPGGEVVDDGLVGRPGSKLLLSVDCC